MYIYIYIYNWVEYAHNMRVYIICVYYVYNMCITMSITMHIICVSNNIICVLLFLVYYTYNMRMSNMRVLCE